MTEQLQVIGACGLILFILNVVIFYLIIKSAVASGADTYKRMKHAWAQTELLIAIARKQGVSDGELAAISNGLK
ncbi:MAG TPA: hypothetical protein VGM90_15795 [Kofleriaceae bacterium]|jgi:hypothetical protein